jgi:hypothetical protein
MCLFYFRISFCYVQGGTCVYISVCVCVCVCVCTKSCRFDHFSDRDAHWSLVNLLGLNTFHKDQIKHFTNIGTHFAMSSIM